jgi:surface protein
LYYYSDSETIYLSGDASQMFNGWTNVQSLSFDNWDTSSVTTMVEMFRYAQNLESLNISSFNTENVINMYGMFDHVSKLT